MRKFTFIWFIENFSYSWHEEDEVLESPPFFVKMMQQTSWKLLLYPRGKDVKNFISLYLKRHDECKGPEVIALNCKLSILYADGRALESEEMQKDNFEFQKGTSFGFPNSYDRSENFLKDRAFTRDVLRVRCTMWIDDGEIDKEAVCYAKTRIGLEKISFIDTIENLAALTPNREETFVTKSLSENPFKVLRNVDVKSHPSSDDEVMVEFSLDSQNVHLMTCQIYMLKSTGKEVECGRIETRNDKRRKRTLRAQINMKKRNLLFKKRKYKQNDKLTLRHECVLSNGIEYHRIEETFYDIQLTPLLEERIRDKNFSLSMSEPKSVSGDFECLYKDKILSDIQLETKTKIFPTHKSVLCARSPVFAQMLTTNMSEKLIDSIQIEDLDDCTIDQFLLFLYTDILEDLQWESALKLYFAAKKYQVQRLKEMCSSFLITQLNRCNMKDVLILADGHKDSDLKKAVRKFIIGSESEIFFTDEWKKFMGTHDKLTMKAMYSYLRNNAHLFNECIKGD